MFIGDINSCRQKQCSIVDGRKNYILDETSYGFLYFVFISIDRVYDVFLRIINIYCTYILLCMREIQLGWYNNF